MKNDKIVLATRTSYDEYDDCIERIKRLKSSSTGNVIHKVYIISNLRKEDVKTDENIEIVFDQNPPRSTAFNLIIDRLRKEQGEEYHLLVFSKEVEFDYSHITRMTEELNKDIDHLIVVGYSLRDNILSDEEYKLYSNDINGNKGIAYQAPWNTCALWNKKFIYSKGKESLRFDEICEKEKNQLGELMVKIDGKPETTNYKGVEAGLAIAGFVTRNNKLKFKLIEDKLAWNIKGDEKKIKEHKKNEDHRK